MVTSHCPNPTTTLTATSIPVPNVGDGNVAIADPGAGNRRGIVVFIHANQSVATSFPPQISSATGTNYLALALDLAGDGWVVAFVSTPEDWYKGPDNITGVAVDVINDPGHGTFNRDTTIPCWWDHVILYLANKYGANRPIIVDGFSMGAHKAMVIAKNRMSTIIGAAAHCPPTIFENIANEPLTPPYSSINWSGYDLSTTWLNTVTIPTLVGYSQSDIIAGWNTAGTPNGTPVSNTDAMITNAVGAGQPCTRYASADGGFGHLFEAADATEHANWIASTFPLAKTF
jgi:dienelactone hydrolase